MKWSVLLCIAVAGLLPVAGAASATATPTAAAGRAVGRNWEVDFSPRGGCTTAVVEALGRARVSVLVQAYSFTSAPIARALVDAQARGVKVQVILDKSQRTEKYSSATFLLNRRVPTYIDDRHAIAHNKVMVIDGHLLVTGSFNFTKAAEENNAENLLVIDDAELAARYAQNWAAHRQHSGAYTELAATDAAPKRRSRKR